MLSFLYQVYNRIAYFMRNAYVKKFLTDDSTPPKLLGKVYLQVKTLKCGKNVTIYPGAYLWGNYIEIGDNVDIGIGTIIYGKKGVKIGSNTSIAGQCYIIDSNHVTSSKQLIREQLDDVASDGIIIGEDVWIGAQCSILKGSRINNGAVIGAQSLVNSEMPSYSIAFGAPARVQAYRK